MTVQPGTYNFVLQRRADYTLDLQLKQGDPVIAVDLTGATVVSQVWNERRTTKYADFAVTYTDRSNGKISIALTDTETAGLPDRVNYDVMVQDSSGVRQYYLEGVITVSQGYSS